MELLVNLKEHSYPIIIENGAIKNIKRHLNLVGKVMIVSDDLIPNSYLEEVKKAYPNAVIKRFPHGENNKNLHIYEEILSSLSENGFSRKDHLIALGGGLTSDLAGFAASSYMRGISFYIIPTTLLSQVDASIGGKVAVNFNGYKNLVGAFYQPKKVIIDPEVLSSLEERLLNEGMAEVIKMACTSNATLFDYIESNQELDYEKLIYESVKIKKDVVQQDEKESNLRKILNFGHTVGHAIEVLGNGNYYHGEAVAIGMTYFVSQEVKARLIPLLKRFSLPYEDEFNVKDIMEKIKHDKKANNDNSIDIIYVPEIGRYEIKKMSLEELERKIGEVKHEK